MPLFHSHYCHILPSMYRWHLKVIELVCYIYQETLKLRILSHYLKKNLWSQRLNQLNFIKYKILTLVLSYSHWISMPDPRCLSCWCCKIYPAWETWWYKILVEKLEGYRNGGVKRKETMLSACHKKMTQTCWRGLKIYMY